MANKPFEYTIINPLERPTSSDINQLQAQAHYDVRQFSYELFGRQNGFLGYSFNAEPNSTPDNTFWVQQGVAFQYGAPENNIGGVVGLSDSYQQKAITIESRNFTAELPPTVVGQRRYDVLMIRALREDERLANGAYVGIYNPALGSFGPSNKFKTLTSSLTDVSVQTVVQPTIGTGPIVYKTGVAGTYAGWAVTPKPTVDTGYLAVAYIRRYFGQTSITASDIVDARTLLTLPIMGGGTNNVDPALFNGSVAWFDTNDGKIKYTQAIDGLYDAPVAGYLLSSNTTGAPTWIAPGAPGQALVSNGTAWVPGIASQIQVHDFSETKFTTNSQQLVTEFTVSAVAGAARISIQPQVNNESGDFYAWNQYISSDRYVWLIFRVNKLGSGVNDYYHFKYSVPGPDSGIGYIQSLAYPSFSITVESGQYEISLLVYSPTSGAANVQVVATGCSLVFAQG